MAKSSCARCWNTALPMEGRQFLQLQKLCITTSDHSINPWPCRCRRLIWTASNPTLTSIGSKEMEGSFIVPFDEIYWNGHAFCSFGFPWSPRHLRFGRWLLFVLSSPGVHWFWLQNQNISYIIIEIARIWVWKLTKRAMIACSAAASTLCWDFSSAEGLLGRGNLLVRGKWLRFITLRCTYGSHERCMVIFM